MSIIRQIVALNAGSSSIKFAVFAGDDLNREGRGKIDRIGSAGAEWTWKSAAGQTDRETLPNLDSEHAIAEFMRRLESLVDPANVAVGHRIVHGGPDFIESQAVTPPLIAGLRKISDFDPEHLPAQINLIEVVGKSWPAAAQVACFDTAFHANLPIVARTLPVPRRLQSLGVRRYGFHGISYAYLLEELARVADPEAATGRVILAHLGNGASMAAVHRGRGIDTTMAFTPTAGMPMSTRSGDLDPSLAFFLNRTEGTTADEFFHMMNSEAGLLGVSETSADMRDLLASRATDTRAAEAVDLFCYSARKWIGAFAAALGGLDTLVFSGGIGENAAEVRQEICQPLEWLGVKFDAAANANGAGRISLDGSAVHVRVIKTDEELMIARDVARLFP